MPKPTPAAAPALSAEQKKRQQAENEKQSFRQILKYLFNHWFRIGMALLFVVGSCVTDVILPIFTGKVIDLMITR